MYTSSSSSETRIINNSHFFNNSYNGVEGYNNGTSGPYVYNSTFSNNGNHGIMGAHTVENCIVNNNSSYGVHSSVEIINSTIVNNGYGVSSIQNIVNSIIL